MMKKIDFYVKCDKMFAMKINLSTIDKESFNFKESILNGQVVTLINPKDFGCAWTKDTLYLRSIMVDFEGNVISRGMNKFFNFSEKPDLYPFPEKHKDWIMSSKEDGSLMICDLIFNSLNVRTRGTASYKHHDNTFDFEFVISKYAIAPLVTKYPEYSFLFELYSPTNVIVLRPYDEPEIVFLGAVHKESGKHYPFYSDFGKEIQTFLKCSVPEIFDMSGSAIDLAANIKTWERKEGVVLSYNGGQNFIKMKSDWYLFRHALKSKLNSLDNLVDMFFELKCPPYQEFFDNIVNTVDYETAMEFQGRISNIIDAYKEVGKIMEGMTNFLGNHAAMSRKDLAAIVFSSYGGEGNNRASFVFSMKDRGTLNDEQKKKLLWQCLKK
jgi:T4 RnlA family RNA ligase